MMIRAAITPMIGSRSVLIAAVPATARISTICSVA